MISIRCAAVLVATNILLTAASASASEMSDFDRFQLWNGCLSMTLYVGKLSDDARDIGLDEENIATVVRSRLRAARIYAPAMVPHLLVNVYVNGSAYVTDIEFRREVRVLLPLHIDSKKPEGIPLIGYAATWSFEQLGMHYQDSTYVLSNLALGVDEFIDDYLHVNDSACNASARSLLCEDTDVRPCLGPVIEREMLDNEESVE